MHLVDSSVFDEILLSPERAWEARAFISAHAGSTLHVSDFGLHSIGVVLRRHQKLDRFLEFLEDMILSGRVKVLTLLPHELRSVVEISRQLGLDFDDAYQYALAERDDLSIVSFDKDFDRTPRGPQSSSPSLLDNG